ncbi:unnamed protein product [Penicillium camemberti]|uniref:Str. FM013 n=1 Tax=Penicillium camemberti (strain FM 013) TaxID=1429867 RepID=A0A0G4P4H5_PENC3|nr:unnamed protein product [Penicillium camemberti]
MLKVCSLRLSQIRANYRQPDNKPSDIRPQILRSYMVNGPSGRVDLALSRNTRRQG